MVVNILSLSDILVNIMFTLNFHYNHIPEVAYIFQFLLET